MRKLFTFLILSLIGSYIFGANLTVKSFRKLEQDMSARIDAPKKDQNGELCAIIKVVTTQTGFSWEPDGLGIVSAESKVGEYWLYIPWGAKRLTIKHPQLGILRDYLYPLPIEKATVYEMKLVTGRVETTVIEEIASQWLVIRAQPANSLIYIDDNFVQKGGKEYQAKLKPGKYNYRVEAPLYHTEAGIIEITDEKKELDVKLKDAFGYISISSSPESGATVLIDNKEQAGTTPCKSQVLASGEHTVQVIRDMYQPVTKKITVTDGQTTPADFVMEPNFAEVSIKVPEGATLFINSKTKSTGSWQGRLSAGVYSLEAQLEKHKEAKKDIEVAAGDNLTFELQPSPIYGSIDVLSTPSGANVLIDGTDKGTTPVTIKDLLIGDYTITLEKTGCGTINKTIHILEGKTTEFSQDLSSGVQVSITSQPTGAVIFLDFKELGKTPYTGHIGYGKHDLSLNFGDNYESINKQIEVTDTNKSFKLYLKEKGKFAYFESVPSKSEVILDGKFIGITPLKYFLGYDTHTVELKLKDYDNYSGTINFNSNSDDKISFNLSTHITNRHIGEKYYNRKPGTLTYGYHHTDFTNAVFENNFSEGRISKEMGHAASLSINPFPYKIDITGFASYYHVQGLNLAEDDSVMHRGVELSLSYYFLNLGKSFYVYGGAGYQLSQLYIGKTFSDNESSDEETKYSMNTSSPILKAGAQLFLGSIVLYGEYIQSIWAAHEANNRQLHIGIGLRF